MKLTIKWLERIDTTNPPMQPMVIITGGGA